MVTGRLTDCSQCGAALWLESEQLEPISALLIGVMTCLRCGANFIYRARTDGIRRPQRDHEAKPSHGFQIGEVR